MQTSGRIYRQVQSSQMIAIGISDPGRMRSHNEDAIWLDEKGHFVLVCDGMGGHERGAEASAIAINVMRDFLDPVLMKQELQDITGVDGVPSEIACLFSLIDEAVEKAATVLYERNQALDIQRYMGTTVVGLVMVEEEYALWFHVGDSRLYLWRDAVLKRLTEDHSAYAEWVNDGKHGTEPGKNVITRAIGPTANVVADIGWDKRQKEDLFILCSDGLTDMITDEQIEEIIRSESDVTGIAEGLVDAANDAGGKDNTSVVVCKIKV